MLRDLKYAVRMLARQPGLGAAVVLTLALGIGANTAIFSLVHGILLRSLPYADADRLVLLDEARPSVPRISVAYLNYRDWQDQARSFEQMAIYRGQTYSLTGDREPERALGAHVSSNIFTTLGVQPALGRTFTREDDRPDANPVAILSHGLWQRRFGADPSVLGRAVTINGTLYAVVGVMPRTFEWLMSAGRSCELWTPIGLLADTPMLSERSSRAGMSVIGRLAPGVTIRQARIELDVIARRLAEEHPETNAGGAILAVPLQEHIVGDTRLLLLALLGAAACVLLIACANVANLFLARATQRSREVAIRMAMGASRPRLIRQFLTESVMLAAAGGLVGVILAVWVVDLLVAVTPSTVPRINEVGLDATVLGFATVLSLLTGVSFGLAPALQGVRQEVSDSLKDRVRGSTAGGRQGWVQSGLVVAEVALALALLVGTGLLLRSFWRIQQTDPGFDPDRLLTIQLVLPSSAYPDEDARRAFHAELLSRIRVLPGVEAAETINPLPVSNTGWQARFWLEGRPHPSAGEVPLAEIAQVTPGYFRMMRIPLVAGRIFTELDHPDAPPVVIIDETFALRYFPDDDPIGKRVATDDQADPRWLEIVGVVGHVKVEGVTRTTRVQMYWPYGQEAFAPMTLLLRTAADPAGVASAIRRQVFALDPDLPVYNVRTMQELLADSVVPNRLGAVLLSVFAGVALLLGAVGVHGIVAHAASRRAREIAIRLAMGANPRGVIRLIVRQGMVRVALGLVIGVLLALSLTRLLGTLLFEVSPVDPLTFGGVAGLLALVSLLAAYLPARRAARANPVTILGQQ